MNIQTEKLDIIQWLATVNDSRVIRQFKLLKQSNEDAANLSEAEKSAINKGLQSIEEGHVKPHEEVTRITQAKYKHLLH